MIASDEFWNNTNSCLQPLRWKGNTSKLYICKRDFRCFNIRNNPTSLKRRDALFQDIRFYNKEVETTWELRMLRTVGIASTKDSWLSLKRKILRVVLNPSDELTQVILQERERIGPAEYQLGVHIRCAGRLSDEKEGVRMVTLEQIPQFQFLTNKLIHSGVFERKGYVFLTTDSTDAEKHFKKGMHEKVVTYTGFKRGHSSYKRATDLTFKRSLVDLYLLAESKLLLLTSKSGYSYVAKVMSTARKVREIHAHYHCVVCWKVMIVPFNCNGPENVLCGNDFRFYLFLCYETSQKAIIIP